MGTRGASFPDEQPRLIFLRTVGCCRGCHKLRRSSAALGAATLSGLYAVGSYSCMGEKPNPLASPHGCAAEQLRCSREARVLCLPRRPSAVARWRDVSRWFGADAVTRSPRHAQLSPWADLHGLAYWCLPISSCTWLHGLLRSMPGSRAAEVLAVLTGAASPCSGHCPDCRVSKPGWRRLVTVCFHIRVLVHLPLWSPIHTVI